MHILTETNSGELLPETTSWVSMMLGATIVILVIGLIFVVVGIVVQKTTGRSQVMGLSFHSGKLVNVGVGAMIIGSGSGLVLWGSGLYSPAKMPEPAAAVPAYETKNDCEPVAFNTKDDTERAKKILGQEQYENLKNHSKDKKEPSWDFDNSYWETAEGESHAFGDETGRVFNDVELKYKPQSKNGECTEVVNYCYQVKLTGTSTFDGKSGGKLGGRPEEWFSAAGYDEGQCGKTEKF